MKKPSLCALLLLPLFVHAQNNLITQPNLRAYYTYESTSANTVTDQAGGNDNATSSTGAWTSGANPSGPGFTGNASFNPGDGLSNRSTLLAGNALNIVDAYNQHLVVPLGSATLGGSFTLSTWHNLTPGAGNTSERFFVFEASDNFDVSWGTGTNNDSYTAYNAGSAAVSATLARNQWNLVTHVFTASGGNTTLQAYLNGSLLGSSTQPTANMSFASLHFGDARNGTSPDRDWDGMLDETSIWTRGLSAGEVASLYSLGQAGLPLSFTTRVKADNLTEIAAGASWSGASPPAAGEVAVFNSTYAQSGTLAVAAPITLSGIQVTSGSTLIDIGNAANAITLGPRGLDMSSAARDLAIANLTASGNQIWDVTSGRTFTAGALAGSGQIFKQGGGGVVLDGAGSFSGTLHVTGGTVQLSGGSALGDTTAVVMSNTAGAALQLNQSERIGSLAGGGASGGNVNLQANTLTVGNSASQAYAGVISGTGSLTKLGSGNLSLQALQTYTGSTTVSQGTLTLDFNQTGSYNVNVIPRDISVGPGAALVVARGGQFGYGAYAETVTLDAATMTFANDIHNYLSHLVLSSGATVTFGTGGYGGIANFGLATVTVPASSAGSTITGGTIQAGLTVDVADGAAANDLTLGTNLADYAGPRNLAKTGDGTLTLTGANNISGVITISAGTLELGNGGTAGSLGGGAGITNHASFRVNRSDAVTLPNNIVGTGTLLQAGAGTTSLTGANSYAGTTFVNQGTLLITGSTAAAGLIQVSPGATLGGSGQGGNAQVASLGRLSPGDDHASHLNLASLTLADDALLLFDLDAPLPDPSSTDPGFFNDHVALTGALALNGVLRITPAAGFGTPAEGDRWLLMAYAAGSLDDGGLVVDPAHAPALSPGLAYLVDTTVPGYIYLAVVPEAGTGALTGLGLLVLLVRKRLRPPGGRPVPSPHSPPPAFFT